MSRDNQRGTLHSFLTTLALVSSVVIASNAGAQSPIPREQIAPSNIELLRRLEAAERELAWLRSQQTVQYGTDDNLAEPLEAQSVGFPGCAAELKLSGTKCECGNCGDIKPVCQGAGAFCDAYKDHLSWCKGDWRIVPFGFLTGEAMATSSQSVARPLVLYIAPQRPTGEDTQQFTVHGQNTAIGFNFSGPCLGSFELGGMILFNFLGSLPAPNLATPFFLRGYGELKNEDWVFRFGQQGDLFNPLNPVTVNFGGHKQAGNGGSFRGSLFAERNFRPSEFVQWKLQGALSQQVVNDFVIDPRVLGTDNGWPNLEWRVALGLGSAASGARPIELGLSGIYGETRNLGIIPGAGIFPTWGLSPDFQIRGERFGMSGEFFVGEALGTYNLGIGQSLDPTGFNSIYTIGGWADVWYKITPYLTTHIGYGVDDPRNSDLGTFPGGGPPTVGQRSRNSVLWANWIWDVSKHMDLAFEVSYRETDWLAPSISSSAMLYHFRARLKY